MNKAMKSMIYFYAVLLVLFSCSTSGYRSLPSLPSLSSSSLLSSSSIISSIRESNVVLDDKAAYIRTLLIDNYDSYTYNIYQLLAETNGLPPIVIYNNDYGGDWKKAIKCLPSFDNIVISPGPGSPDKHEDFGLCKDAILEANVPVFGVCLGHQGIAHVYGGKVVTAPYPMHGRLSSITHTCNDLFESIDQHTNVVRYHSLVAQSPLPPELEATAWTEDGVIMALKHKTKPIYGVQFHPESISTSCGRMMFSNFKKMTVSWMKSSPVVNKSNSIFNNHYKEPKDDNLLPFNSNLQQKRLEKEKHISVMRIDSSISSEFLFEMLYGKNAAAFWLDSASAGVNFMSQAASMSKISILGAIDTPTSQVVEYADHNKLFIRSENGTTFLEKNIFEYLDEKLKDYAEHKIHVELDNFDGELPFNFTGGLFGYLGYELRTETTHILTHSSRNNVADASNKFDYGSTRSTKFQPNKWVGKLNHPLALFMAPSRYVVYDHTHSVIYVVATAEERSDARNAAKSLLEKIESINEHDVSSTTNTKPLPSKEDDYLISDKSAQDYHRAISTCAEQIKTGESYELCLTAQFHGRISDKHSHMEHYKNLRSRNPAPFSCYLHYDVSRFQNSFKNKETSFKWMKSGGFSICSSSPERFFSATEDGFIESKPIKGTAQRDLSDSNKDKEIAMNLAKDEKSRAENLMIVDLLRNDFGRICSPGSVCVPKLMDIETYASVHQLVSTVRGKLSPQTSVVDALVATFPGGSMTGAPKIRTMDIIDDLEGRPRGIYSGALGYIGFNGVTDLNIVIRTALLESETITVGAGGAIVAMSDASKEIEEVLLKARAVSASFDRDIKWLPKND